jgi:hypothetical protein
VLVRVSCIQNTQIRGETIAKVFGKVYTFWTYQGVEAPLALSDDAVKAVPDNGTVGIDDDADNAPLDNTEALTLFVQLAPLIDKSRCLALALGLAAP